MLKMEKKLRMCNYCSKQINLSQIFLCPFCDCEEYCSNPCFLLDWKLNHHKNCQVIKESINIKNNFSIKNSLNLIGEYLSDYHLQNKERAHDTIKLKDLKLIFNNSGLPKLLGEGTFSTVYLYRDLHTGIYYAVKSIKYDQITHGYSKEKFNEEIELHLRMRHPNIITLHSYIIQENSYQLIMEYAEGGTLDELIKRKKLLNYDQAIFLFGQICNGIKFLHSNNIMHRDLKSNNILITKSRIVKLCDFGYSVRLKEYEKFFSLEG